MILRSIVAVFTVLVYIAPPAGAQDNLVSLGHLTTAQGLSQDFVTAIAQDRDGFMWFGTNDGLTRFDGSRCTVYRHHPTDTASLPDNRITGLTLDPDGRLWVTTFKGLAFLDPATYTFRRVPLPTPGRPDKPLARYASNLAFNPQGTGWVVCDSFLFRLDRHTFQTNHYPVPVQPRQEIQVFADSRGRVWITIVGRHLFLFEPAQSQMTYVRGLDKPNGALRPWPMSVGEDRNGVIWNADWDQAFYTFDETTRQFVNLPEVNGIATVFLFEERPGQAPLIWAGGGAHGLWRCDPADGRRLEFPNDPRDPFSHNNSRVYALYRDPRTGILWIGTELGVEYYDPNGIKFGRVLLPQRPGQNQFYSVSGIMTDPRERERYWVCVWGVGLYEWSRRDGTFKLYEYNDKGLYSNEIFDVALDKQGMLWLATFQGLERFDPVSKERRHFRQPPPGDTPGDKVLSVTAAPDGRIWGGDNRGMLFEVNPATGATALHALYRYDGTTFPVYPIWNIDIDQRGRVLAGSPNGLFRYDPATGKNDHLLYNDPPRPVTDAVQTADRRLYVGATEGVYVLDERDSLLFVLNVEDGLPNHNVRKLDADSLGFIWIATANGLHRYDPRLGLINSYSKDDGLFVSDLSQGFKILPNGEIFVSGDYSFNLARHDALPDDHCPPRLVVDLVKTPNRTLRLRPGEALTLRPGDNVVSFDIAIIHFTQPEKCRLAYRLKGFDDAWTETDLRVITFTNLAGGQYTLQVRALNGAGVWSDQILEIPLRVIPPYYKSWWFRALAVFALLGIALAIVRYRQELRRRVEAIQQRTKELERQHLLNEIALLKTQVNPHFLFNSLSILSSLVRVDPDLAEQFIDQLSRSYRYILEQKEQSLVSLRTELEFIQSYLFLLKIRFDDKFDLRIRLDEAELDEHMIAPLTLQLLIENAVKHNRMSKQEPLIVEVSMADGILLVKNRLQPRPTPATSTGVGLKNIADRYALLTDRPVWSGAEGEAFVVRVPLL